MLQDRQVDRRERALPYAPARVPPWHSGLRIITGVGLDAILVCMELVALQSNTDWARSSSRLPPVGRAIASVQRSGSLTPFSSCIVRVASSDYVVFPHASTLAVVQVRLPLLLIPLAAAHLPPDAQVISIASAQIPLTADALPSPVICVAFLASSGTVQSSGGERSAEKEGAPRCCLLFYGGISSTQVMFFWFFFFFFVFLTSPFLHLV